MKLNLENGKTRKGQTKYLVSICVQRTGRQGNGPDAKCMTEVWGDRDMKKEGPGVTSGLCGRGALRRSSLVELTPWDKCGNGSKTNKQTHKQVSGNACLLVDWRCMALN